MEPDAKMYATYLPTIGGIAALLIFAMAYPFLPGGYDAFASPLSTMTQAGGVFSLLFVPVGILWLFHTKQSYWYGVAAIILGFIFALVTSLIALMTIGPLFALLWFTTSSFLIWKLLSRLSSRTGDNSQGKTQIPAYLIVIPVTLVLAQFLLAAPLTEWSRNRAIENSEEFIRHIETYKAQYQHYPTALTAQWKDYYPDVVGVEKYHYLLHGNSYNVSFEQPRFLFDQIGTHEWVVYNPKDEHRVYSHISWFLLLSPKELERSQGWYSVNDASTAHWKYFWFD